MKIGEHIFNLSQNKKNLEENFLNVDLRTSMI